MNEMHALILSLRNIELFKFNLFFKTLLFSILCKIENHYVIGFTSVNKSMLGN